MSTIIWGENFPQYVPVIKETFKILNESKKYNICILKTPLIMFLAEKICIISRETNLVVYGLEKIIDLLSN